MSITVENLAVALIVGGALLFTGRRLMGALRSVRKPSSGCDSGCGCDSGTSKKQDWAEHA